MVEDETDGLLGYVRIYRHISYQKMLVSYNACTYIHDVYMMIA